MAAEWLWILVLYLAIMVVVRSVCLLRWPFRVSVPRGLARQRARGGSDERRPLEDIAQELGRLSARYHHPARGTSRTKVEAARHAYDRRLGEAATALGIVHLLDVLEPGSELDAERQRVEARLWLAGMRFEDRFDDAA